MHAVSRNAENSRSNSPHPTLSQLLGFRCPHTPTLILPKLLLGFESFRSLTSPRDSFTRHSQYTTRLQPCLELAKAGKMMPTAFISVSKSSFCTGSASSLCPKRDPIQSPIQSPTQRRPLTSKSRYLRTPWATSGSASSRDMKCMLPFVSWKVAVLSATSPPSRMQITCWLGCFGGYKSCTKITKKSLQLFVLLVRNSLLGGRKTYLH